VTVVGGPEDPSFRLRCRRLIYEEDSHRIYAEGDVFLARQGVELRAGRITVTLSEDGSDIRFIRARFNVSASQVLGDDLQSFSRFEANELALSYDEATGKISRAELDARRAEQVFIEAADATQLARRLTAPRLLVTFEDGKPDRVEAFRSVEIKEYLVFAPRVILLLTCSTSAVAEIDDGRFETIWLRQGVDIHQLDMQAVGDRVVRRAEGEATEIEGDPAAIYTSRGDLVAPAITHFGAGRALASGGVRATMTRSGGFEMIRDAEGEESPIRVTARDAEWDEADNSVTFSGDVRAWQGEDFIVAERLSGEEGGDRLRAERNVKTVITSRREPDADTTAEEMAPVEVTAGQMVYERKERVLRYFDSPIARQAGRTLSCNDLQLRFDAEEELERMVCRGGVVMEERTENRLIRGDIAVYTPGQSLLEVGGTPAFLQNPDGVEVRGSVVVYDLESGRANVRAGEVELYEEGGLER
jgi:lipopolysaccharide export system protein LptA